MVARIICARSIAKAVGYNEQKLKQGVAEFIHAANYLKDTEDLGFTDRLVTLQKLAALNERTQVNSVHISLNFDPSENLSKEKLKAIADSYMQRVGFGQQPYLVYQHHDSGHPHIHLVTTNIQRDGSRIALHNIGKYQSEKARIAIEKDFKLVPAQRLLEKQVQQIKPLRITYGKMETKRAMTNVLNAVLPHYKYTSLPELNAVLKQYNMMADRCSEGSRTHDRKGLLYRVINEKGEKVGVPIKASDFYFRPTLKYLEQKFSINEELRQQHKQQVRNAIDFAVFKNVAGISKLERDLQKEQIQLVLRQSDKGIIYGVTYIDHSTKSVFNGSDLGKPYSANQLQQRCDPQQQTIGSLKHSQRQSLKEDAISINKENAIGRTINEILKPEDDNQFMATELRDEVRKRKRKRHHL